MAPYLANLTKNRLFFRPYSKNFGDMKLYKVVFSLLFFLMSASVMSAQQQPPQQPDVYEQAEQEADRLQRLLELEDWQTFYVDSTLKHDLPAIMDEYAKLQAAKVSNTSLYVDVRDKWMERIDSTYRTIFTDEQWAAYLKTGAAREQKARAKRRAKAEGKK